jgi:phenylacetate-coenzyme A ligase PaaK-like adenylate-forming protein
MSEREINDLTGRIFEIQSASDFGKAAMEIFRFQATHCKIYREFLNYLKIAVTKVETTDRIPFLPVNFFRTTKVTCAEKKHDELFISSGTTGTGGSRHYVYDRSIYKTGFFKTFKLFYGDLPVYRILALLPSYYGRKDSSLIYMVKHLIAGTGNPESGFYHENADELVNIIGELEKKNKKAILIGLSFALLDLAEKYRLKLNNTIVMETGGMKGRRAEITRAGMHDFLCERFGLEKIHSEYGMTELLTQAYSPGEGFFSAPPWMKVMIRDMYDPFQYHSTGKTGGINIIDLANIWSCSFIETQDIGRINNDGTFEVLGRIDNTEIRGCNLMV